MFQVSLRKLLVHTAVASLITSGSLISSFAKPAPAQTQPYCDFTQETISEKDNLRKASLKGNSSEKNKYKNILKKHGEILRQCREQSWLKNQSVWLRLYSCDVKAGMLDEILDQIVNRGYNKVYLEVFFDSQVLLPQADNPTPWRSVVDLPGEEKTDLLDLTIKKGRERGLKVYAWMFSLNFGYSYAQRRDRQGVLARNGKGENSLSFVHDNAQAFVDPYNRQAQVDYYRLVEKIIERRPDGILFDYIRYPRGTGTQSVVSKVKDLWIYSPASKQALYQRAMNNQGRMLIHRYVNQGYISTRDIQAVRAMSPGEITPRWQGRNPQPNEAKMPLGTLQKRLNIELWHLAVAHAAQGVIDFITFASSPVRAKGIKTGAVFFPGGNQLVGERGFDSRLQAWHQFPAYLEWHPMSYALCGHTNCIIDEVRRVTDKATGSTSVIPAIAGLWGRDDNDNRPSLEKQMEAIRMKAPQINSISHFAYSWQDPGFDRKRKFCRI